MRDDNPLSRIRALFERFAPRVDATVSTDEPLGWFDGFWDFVTTNREALEHRPSCQMGGDHAGLPWFLLCWESAEGLRLDMFVELKAPRGRAPWPVTTINLDASSLAPAKAPPPRPHDEKLATTLRSSGFEVELGHWGIRTTARDPSRALRDGVSALEYAFNVTIKLAQSVANAET